MSRQYRHFSADSHFECLPETWTHRVPAKFRDRAPRRIKLADGRDAIVEEGQPLEYRGTNFFAGKPLEEFNPVHLNFEGSVGAGSPQATAQRARRRRHRRRTFVRHRGAQHQDQGQGRIARAHPRRSTITSSRNIARLIPIAWSASRSCRISAPTRTSPR